MGGAVACNSLLSNDVVPVPSGPPRKVEVEAVNSTAVKVSWRSPVPNKQHGQIRGYQVHYVRMENGEPKGQPMLKDIMLADAQVIGALCSFLGHSENISFTREQSRTALCCLEGFFISIYQSTS